MQAYNADPEIETVVNRIMSFILDLCFEKEFQIKPEQPFNLNVCGDKRQAIPDFSLSGLGDSEAKFKGLLVVEDKTDKSQGDGEAQMIAEGIAVTQQEIWKTEWPLFMILCKGTKLSLYKANFSKRLLDNVREGYDCAQKTIVQKLNKIIRLESSDDLVEIMRIFHIIKEEIKSRF